MPNTDDPDYIKRWKKAKEKILKADSLWEQIVKMSNQNLADYRQLQSSDPMTITEYFISRMIQQ